MRTSLTSDKIPTLDQIDDSIDHAFISNLDARCSSHVSPSKDEPILKYNLYHQASPSNEHEPDTSAQKATIAPIKCVAQHQDSQSLKYTQLAGEMIPPGWQSENTGQKAHGTLVKPAASESGDSTARYSAP